MQKELLKNIRIVSRLLRSPGFSAGDLENEIFVDGTLASIAQKNSDELKSYNQVAMANQSDLVVDSIILHEEDQDPEYTSFKVYDRKRYVQIDVFCESDSSKTIKKTIKFKNEDTVSTTTDNGDQLPDEEGSYIIGIALFLQQIVDSLPVPPEKITSWLNALNKKKMTKSLEIKE
jgi:hypothetical protein